jgi:hypothetical protein
MATITNAVLSIVHDHNKQTANVTVRCNVNFTVLELCQMKTCKGRWFKLKCQLWGKDGGIFTGGDDFLFTIGTVFFFPDATPTSPEARTFNVLLGEGVLDEDLGQDEIYGKLILSNLNTLVTITKKTNVVSHSF